MSLHKHHLLQVQEQIVSFLWSSSDTALGRGAGRGAGPGAGTGRSLLSSPGTSGCSPPRPGWQPALRPAPRLGAAERPPKPRSPSAFGYGGARAQPADRRTQPGPSRPPSPVGLRSVPAPCGGSQHGVCSLPVLPRAAPGVAERWTGRAGSLGSEWLRDLALRAVPAPNVIRLQKLNCAQKGRHSSSSTFAWRGTR